jgi:hypothetical protein
MAMARAREQQRRWHHPRRGEHCEQSGDDQEVGLHPEHQPTPIERIGEHSCRQRQQHHRQRARGLNQRHNRGRVRVVHEQPLRTHRLRPAPRTGHHHPEPQPEKRSMPKWRQR